MIKVGFIGWRGMVGSVLLERMLAEDDFSGFEPTFFTTSQEGAPGPEIGLPVPPLVSAYQLDVLAQQEILVTCQGGDYTQQIHPQLREIGWKGYWIDAASTLRMMPDSVIVLDPVNREVIDAALNSGIRDFIGGNCTVSLMLMGLIGLIRPGWVDWISAMTYQSASGAGAKNMQELVAQMKIVGNLEDPSLSALSLADTIHHKLHDADFPIEAFGAPLAASLIPWIDRAMPTGQTREEWKGGSEAEKILGASGAPKVDGQCVRVGALRCHSQALTVKLNRDVPLAEIEAAIQSGNEWVKFVPNTKEATLAQLTPAAVSGHLDIAVGRVRKMNLGPEYLTLFTVGDQLLWGAAEPVRRMLNIVLGRL